MTQSQANELDRNILSIHDNMIRFLEAFDNLPDLLDEKNSSNLNYIESIGDTRVDDRVDDRLETVFHQSSSSYTSSSRYILEGELDEKNSSNRAKAVLLSLLTGRANQVIRKMVERGAFTLRSIERETGEKKELVYYVKKQLEGANLLTPSSKLTDADGPPTNVFAFIGVDGKTVTDARATHKALFKTEKEIYRDERGQKKQASIEKIIRDIHDDPERETSKGIKYVSHREISQRIEDLTTYPKPEIDDVREALETDPGWKFGNAWIAEMHDKIAVLGEKEYSIQNAIEPWRKAYLKTGIGIDVERIQQIHPKWDKETVLRVFRAVHAPKEKSVNAGRTQP